MGHRRMRIAYTTKKNAPTWQYYNKLNISTGQQDNTHSSVYLNEQVKICGTLCFQREPYPYLIGLRVISCLQRQSVHTMMGTCHWTRITPICRQYCCITGLISRWLLCNWKPDISSETSNYSRHGISNIRIRKSCLT